MKRKAEDNNDTEAMNNNDTEAMTTCVTIKGVKEKIGKKWTQKRVPITSKKKGQTGSSKIPNDTGSSNVSTGSPRIPDKHRIL